jgi:hypothetical protein
MQSIDDFIDLIKAGTNVGELLRRHARLFADIRAAGLVKDYRLGRGRMKRLRDEVAPVELFLRGHADAADRVQFPLNSSVPDCNVWHRTPIFHRTIEVTVAQARERLNRMTELNDTGWGRGFIGITDDRPKKEFVEKMVSAREAYSTDQVRDTMVAALSLCASNKAHSRGDTLIISADMGMLPRERWMEMQAVLGPPISGLGFREVFLVGYPDEAELCLKLK